MALGSLERVCHAPMRPNRLIVRAYLLRGARLWLGSRGLVSLMLLLRGFDPLRLSSVAMLTMIVLSVAVCFADTRRLRERALLGNLGVSPFILGALFAGPAIIGEAALATLRAALA